MLLRMVGAWGETSHGRNGSSLSTLHAPLVNRTAAVTPREMVSNSIEFSLNTELNPHWSVVLDCKRWEGLKYNKYPIAMQEKKLCLSTEPHVICTHTYNYHSFHTKEIVWFFFSYRPQAEYGTGWWANDICLIVQHNTSFYIPTWVI